MVTVFQFKCHCRLTGIVCRGERMVSRIMLSLHHYVHCNAGSAEGGVGKGGRIKSSHFCQ